MTETRKLIATALGVAALSAAVMGNTASCGGPGGPARSATAAGDGITQFGDPSGARNWANSGATGKLKWNITYNAHKQHPSNVQNCRWSLYSIDADGVSHFIKKGTYANAKVRVGTQVSRKFYLKSLECGLWES